MNTINLKQLADTAIRNNQESRLMTVRETAEFLRLKESTIRDWVLRRKITFVKLGGRVFIREMDAQELINRSIVLARPEPDSPRDTNEKEQGARI